MKIIILIELKFSPFQSFNNWGVGGGYSYFRITVSFLLFLVQETHCLQMYTGNCGTRAICFIAYL